MQRRDPESHFCHSRSTLAKDRQFQCAALSRFRVLLSSPFALIPRDGQFFFWFRSFSLLPFALRAERNKTWDEELFAARKNLIRGNSFYLLAETIRLWNQFVGLFFFANLKITNHQKFLITLLFSHLLWSFGIREKRKILSSFLSSHALSQRNSQNVATLAWWIERVHLISETSKADKLGPQIDEQMRETSRQTIDTSKKTWKIIFFLLLNESRRKINRAVLSSFSFTTRQRHVWCLLLRFSFVESKSKRARHLATRFWIANKTQMRNSV